MRYKDALALTKSTVVLSNWSFLPVSCSVCSICIPPRAVCSPGEKCLLSQMKEELLLVWGVMEWEQVKTDWYPGNTQKDSLMFFWGQWHRDPCRSKLRSPQNERILKPEPGVDKDQKGPQSKNL